LWIPATFQECHSGDSGTWRHNNGNWYRGDYVAIPQSWFYQECCSWISEDVDASLAKEDHRAAFVQLRATSEFISKSTKQESPTFDEEALLSAIAAHSPGIYHCIPSWTTDVHTHVHQISAGLASTFAAVYEKPPPKPRKTTMRPATWELVTLKRTTRNTLSALQQQQRWNLLRTCFTAWVLHQSYDGSFRVYGAASSQAFLACCQTFASTTQTEAIQSNSYVLAALG